jgi:hypothetical protein
MTGQVIFMLYFILAGFYIARFYYKDCCVDKKVVTLGDLLKMIGCFIIGFIIAPFIIIMTSEDIVLFSIKKKKQPKIDKSLFEGNQQVYNSTHDRVQNNLKEFKEPTENFNWRA